eukprot:TRINITY_DN17076_c0_g1_i2.p4 TRINITY_DN17076_c0_g1~~TRINITY_DN17076_c0_g1_i2.p4  ORF type:complete len:107 (-),score=23.14 TRINITY_DN17076_c0_g1_i2:146-466(-)
MTEKSNIIASLEVHGVQISLIQGQPYTQKANLLMNVSNYKFDNLQILKQFKSKTSGPLAFNSGNQDLNLSLPYLTDGGSLQFELILHLSIDVKQLSIEEIEEKYMQ